MLVPLSVWGAALVTFAHAEEPSKPSYCATTFSFNVEMYKGCIANRAEAFEVTGDAADSIATAAVQACGEYRRKLADHLTNCESVLGYQILDQEAKAFHDYAVGAVVEYRAKRLSKGKKAHQ
jgi:hypothetical protein